MPLRLLFLKRPNWGVRVTRWALKLCPIIDILYSVADERLILHSTSTNSRAFLISLSFDVRCEARVNYVEHVQ
jgi:hypothetical protein